MPKLIGLGVLGLLPGGPRGEKHIHCASALPNDRRTGVVLAGFRGRGVDVSITLDYWAMHRDYIRIYRTSTNALSIQRDVPVEHIDCVQFLPAGLTIYKRGPPVRLEQVETVHCVRQLPVSLAPRPVVVHELLGTSARARCQGHIAAIR